MIKALNCSVLCLKFMVLAKVMVRQNIQLLSLPLQDGLWIGHLFQSILDTHVQWMRIESSSQNKWENLTVKRIKTVF